MDSDERQLRAGEHRNPSADWEDFFRALEHALDSCQQCLTKERDQKRAVMDTLRAKQERERALEQSLLRLEEEYARLEGAWLNAETSAAEASSRASELEKLLAEQESALEDLKRREATLLARTSELDVHSEVTSRLAAAEREIEQLQRALTERTRELAEVRKAHIRSTADTEAQIHTLESTCEQLEARLAEERSRVRIAREEQQELERERVRLEGEVAAARAQLEDVLSKAGEEVGVWKDTCAALEKERDALHARVLAFEKASSSSTTMNAGADAGPTTGPATMSPLGKRPRRSLLASPAQRVPVETRDPRSGRPSPFFGSVQRRLLQTPTLRSPVSYVFAEDGIAGAAADKATPATVAAIPSEASWERLAREGRHLSYMRSLLGELEARLPLLEEQKRRFQFVIAQFDRMHRALQESELATEHWKQRAATVEREQAQLNEQLHQYKDAFEHQKQRIQELEGLVASTEASTGATASMTVPAHQLAQLEAELEHIRRQRQEFEAVVNAVVKQRDLYRQLLLRSLRGEQVAPP